MPYDDDDPWGDGYAGLPEVKLQNMLFGGQVDRHALLGYEAKPQGPKLRVLVCPNADPWPIFGLTPSFLDYAGLNVEFTIDTPDVALPFTSVAEGGFDAVLVWLDIGCFDGDYVWAHINRRMAALRDMTEKPFLLAGRGDGMAPSPETAAAGAVSFYAAGYTKKWLAQAEGLWGIGPDKDEDAAIAAGLACQCLPALFGRRISAIMVDLDGTLYNGYDRKPSRGHLAFQRKLAGLAGQGVKLCLVSRNNPEDVDWIFEPGSGFALKREDFTEVSASWDAKSATILAMSGRLGIVTDEMVFIDDEPENLEDVRAAIPDIRLIHAKSDAMRTLEALEHCPGLLTLEAIRRDQRQSL